MEKIIFEPQYPAELYTKRPNETALLSPLYDFTFKSIFSQETEESDIALKSFLSAVLGRTIKKVTIKNNEPTKETRNQKNMTFDVNVEFDDGEISDIEMQAWKQNYDYGIRAEILASRLLNNKAKRSRKWEAPKIYQISLLNFHYGINTDGKSDNTEIKWYTMRDKQGNRLTDRLNIIFIDLETIRDKLFAPAAQLTPVEKWGLFFCYIDHVNVADVLRKIIKDEEGLMAAEKIVKQISKSDDNWYLQNSYYIAECDKNTSIFNAKQEGIKEGALQRAIENAVTLIRKYNAKPEDAAKDMNAPLDKVLDALNLQKN